MRIFVTGATGFLGGHFVNHATQAGHSVRAHRRAEHTSSKVQLIEQPDWVTCPQLNNLCETDFKKCDALVHFAASGVSPQPADWISCYEANVVHLLSILEMARNAGVSKVVIAGTFAEYGNSGLRYEKVAATAPLEPTDVYASSKAASSIAATAYARKHKTILTYLRIFSAFGEGQNRDNLWPSLRYAAIAGDDFPMTFGEQIRDFIPANNVAEAFLQAVQGNDVQPGSPLVKNVGSGNPQSIRSFSEYWWAHWNATGRILYGAIPYRSTEVMRYVPEI